MYHHVSLLSCNFGKDFGRPRILHDKLLNNALQHGSKFPDFSSNSNQSISKLHTTNPENNVRKNAPQETHWLLRFDVGFCWSSCKIQVWENWPIRTLGTSLLCLATSCGIHWNPRPTCCKYCKYQELPSIFPENVRKEMPLRSHHFKSSRQLINKINESQRGCLSNLVVLEASGKVWAKGRKPTNLKAWANGRNLGQTILIWMKIVAFWNRWVVGFLPSTNWILSRSCNSFG